LVLALVAGVAVYAVAVLYAGYRQIAESLVGFRWLTFAPAQISGFQFSEAGLGLTTTEAFPRSRPPVGNGTPERIPA
jgi:hypothetical protein